MKFLMRLFMLALAILSNSVYSQGLEGSWQGHAETATERTRVILQIHENNGQFSGSMTLPDVGVAGWPFIDIGIKGNQATLTLPSDSGPQVMQLTLLEDSLQGTWGEAVSPEIGKLHLTRVKDEPRIQETRVQIDGPAGKIGASLILPGSVGVAPAVVFTHGSGPQPRDASRFAAQQLAAAGIASVIYDKRGVGESAGDFSLVSFDDLAADAIAVADFLKARDDIAGVGFFGHSQGGWIAPLAGATWPNTAFVITSAGPAVSPAREAEWPIINSLRQQGFNEVDQAQARRLIATWHEGLRNKDDTRFAAAFAGAQSEPWFAAANLEEFFNTPSDAFIESYRLYMDHDPLTALTDLKAPMLAILSLQDESIDAVETRDVLQSLARPNIRITVYDGYDHAMRRLADDGARLRWPSHPTDYYAIQTAFIHSVHY